MIKINFSVNTEIKSNLHEDCWKNIKMPKFVKRFMITQSPIVRMLLPESICGQTFYDGAE